MTDGRKGGRRGVAFATRGTNRAARVIESSQKHGIIRDDRTSPRYEAVSVAKNRPKAAAVVSSSAKSRRELFQLLAAGGYDHGSEIRTAATTPRAFKALVW
jgi:hypothetical protein